MAATAAPAPDAPAAAAAWQVPELGYLYHELLMWHNPGQLQGIHQ